MTRSIHLAIVLGLSEAACAQEELGTEVGKTTEALGATSPGDLTLSLSFSAPLVQGASDTATVTLTNTTAAIQSNISFGVDFESTSVHASPGACAKLGGGTPLLACQLASLAPGASASFPFTIVPTVAGPVTFGVNGAPSGQIINTLSDDEVVAPGSTDLQVTGSSNQGAPPVNSSFTYTFQVKNNGPFATAGSASFSDTLPPTLAFVSVTTSAGTCSGGAPVACDLGTLAVGAQATIAITVNATSAGSIVDTASASLPAGQADRLPANDSVSVTVTAK